MTRSLLALAAAAPLLAACAGLGGPGPRQAEVRTPAAYATSEGVVLPDAALERWWTLYNDPELTALVEEALAANADVRAALARLEEARATRASLIRGLSPRGDLSGGVQVQDTSGSAADGGGGVRGGGQGAQFGQIAGMQNSANLGLTGSQELDVFGRNLPARQTINAEFLASRFAADSVRAAAAAQTADALFLARGTAVQLEDARETLRIATELSRVTRIRAERGLSPRSEFDRAETERFNALAEIARLEAAVRAGQRVLLTLTGRSGEPAAAVPVRAVLYDAPGAPAAVPAALLVRRLDVREAQARIDAATGNLRRARLALLPTFTLTPGVGLTRTSSDLFSASNAFWNLGAGLLVPVLDRGRLLAEVQVSGARAEQAVIGYERAVQTAVSEADQALVQLEGERMRVVQLTEAEARARAAYDAAQRGYQAGLTDLQVLLDAERAYRGARSALSAARTSLLQRSVQAFRALGGGWSPQSPSTPSSPPSSTVVAAAQGTAQ
ncbi:MAG: TolC family protein [Proteobacteria bacterium]|nr:TolC family protein [Pseudomonadota bacterium]